MLLFVCVAAFIAGCAIASPQANQYIDTVLHTTLQNELRAASLDPAQVSDFNVPFYDHIKIIGKVKGNADFTHGSLTGLSHVRRFSECQGPAFNAAYLMVINCSLEFHDLKISYDGKMKYGKMPNVNIKGSAEVTSTRVFVEVFNPAPNVPPALTKLDLQMVGSLNPKFTGLGPLNRFLKFLEDGFKQQAQAHILNSFSEKFKSALTRAVAAVPMPN